MIPTKELNQFWIYAKNNKVVKTANIGKWLLFINKSDIDKTWELIKKETELGNLGHSSKVSTKRGWLRNNKPNNYVICVYTRNHNDKNDVFRVRNRLKELGFTKELSYKTDWATLNNKNELKYKK